MRWLRRLGGKKRTRRTVVGLLVLLAVMFLGVLGSKLVLSYGATLLATRAAQQFLGSPETTWATYVEVYNTSIGITDTQQMVQRLQRPFTVPAAFSPADWVALRHQEGAITAYTLTPQQDQVLVQFKSGKTRCFTVDFVERDGLFLLSRLEPCEQSR